MKKRLIFLVLGLVVTLIGFNYDLNLGHYILFLHWVTFWYNDYRKDKENYSNIQKIFVLLLNVIYFGVIIYMTFTKKYKL